LLIGLERIPRRQPRRAHRELGVLRNNAELFLTLERHLAILVPAHIELAFELRDPILRRVMRRMRRARCHIEEERPLGRDASDPAYPPYGMVGQVRRQVVVWLGRGRAEIAL